MIQLKFLFLLISTFFVVYGLLPYKYCSHPVVSEPNILLVQPQECGCPCPNARIIRGVMDIPFENVPSGFIVDSNEVDFTIDGFNPYEVEYSQLLLKGKIVGFDTISCSSLTCELTPKLEVSEWYLTERVWRVWRWPKWIVYLYFIHLFILYPIQIILSVYCWILNKRGSKTAGNMVFNKCQQMEEN